MSEAIKNALILRFMRMEGMSLDDATAEAEAIMSSVEEPQTAPAPQTAPLNGDEVGVRRRVAVVGPDGLTDIQRSAVGNVGLCPNCQQPNTYHLPGCARQSGEDSRAVTKNALPPSV